MIGIISAMQEEIQALHDVLQDEVVISKGMRTYHKGTLFGNPVVLVFSRWGKVASATTVTQLINDFEVDKIIFTGVGGSINENINIGDIIIGKNLYQHDMNASPIIPVFEIPLLQKAYFETSDHHREKLLKAVNIFLKKFHTIFPASEQKKFNISNPKVFVNDIASGDQFITNSRQINYIKNNLPTVSCVEMEGAAVAQVCFEYNIPFSILRTISDKANDNSHIDFPAFAKQIASKYALGILEEYLKN
ncbi:MAG: 5'-methylthioadenosine/adenosylhomocysteine nucleosidase [Bacteroidota bacterium]